MALRFLAFVAVLVASTAECVMTRLFPSFTANDLLFFQRDNLNIECTSEV